MSQESNAERLKEWLSAFEDASRMLKLPPGLPSEFSELLRSILADLESRGALARQRDALLKALKQIVEGDLNPDVGFSAVKGLFHEAAPTWMRDAAAAIALCEGAGT